MKESYHASFCTKEYREMQNIRVGIIGLGAIGHRVAAGFQRHSEVTITAVCDLNEALAKEMANKLECAHWFTDYRELLNRDLVDLAYIAVPPKFHHQIAMDVIEHEKHVLCEKPLALSLEEAIEMHQFASQKLIVTALNLPLHYSKGINTFSKHVQAGYVGDIRHMDIQLVYPQWPRAWQVTPWVGGREQGGPIRETCPHWFHVVLREFGPVKRVFADVTYPEDETLCETEAVGILELENGTKVFVNLLANLPQPETVGMTIYGTQGTLALKNWDIPYGVQGSGGLEPLPVDEHLGGSLIDELVRAVRGDNANLCGFDVGVEIQRVLDAWERAALVKDWVDVR
jgi:predicted dehydrogenase